MHIFIIAAKLYVYVYYLTGINILYIVLSLVL